MKVTLTQNKVDGSFGIETIVSEENEHSVLVAAQLQYDERQHPIEALKHFFKVCKRLQATDYWGG
jgi:hypothetical protein